MEKIADRISKGLEICQMKQADLVELTKIGKSSISTYISGAYEPKQRNIYKIAKALNVSEAWLMGYDVPMKPTTENGSELDTSEQTLVDTYRDMTSKGQKVLLDTAEALHENFKKEADTISDNDKVG